MADYRVYVTRYDSLGVIEEVGTARGLSFTLPVSDHGECRFTGYVRPGDLWRSALALPFSGILVARDDVPVWSGMVAAEQETGEREFAFTAREWGWPFEEFIEAAPRTWTEENDHTIFQDLARTAQLVAGQDFQVEVGTTTGAAYSTRTITSWDYTTVGREFRSVGENEGGPEWYFAAGGTLEQERRILSLADRHGHTTASTVLEYVEDTEDVPRAPGPPEVGLLGDVLPGPTPAGATRRAGGNVIAKSRERSLAESASRVVLTGAGEDAAKLRRTATASTLLGIGWPRLTRHEDHSDVSVASTLQRKANAELARRAGIATGYRLTTLDGDLTADWTQTPRGSTVRVVLDTDVYGADRPVGGPDGFDARCVDVEVTVPDDGQATVEWMVADVLEVQ